jgi:hypothetical protein
MATFKDTAEKKTFIEAARYQKDLLLNPKL